MQGANETVDYVAVVPMAITCLMVVGLLPHQLHTLVRVRNLILSCYIHSSDLE